MPAPIPETHQAPSRSLAWLPICAALATLQVLWAGYGFGVGNQSIQIAFLRRLINPARYAGDDLLSTLPDYPCWLFRALAAVWPAGLPLEPAYLLLHLLVAFAVMGAAWALARTWFRSDAAGFATVLLLAAGSGSGLAESDLYSLGFTHTWAAFPMALGALALLFGGRALPAFLLLGLLANVHLLMAGYTGVVFAGVIASDPRAWRWRRLAAGAAGAALLALPTLLQVAAARHAAFDAAWLRLLHIRSAHHVFPSSWWRPGETRVPAFLLLTGFAAVGWSAAPPPAGPRRRLVGMVAAIVALVTAGTVFAEVVPVPIVLRAQLFRSTRFLALLALALAAHGAIAPWRAAGEGERPRWPARLAGMVVLAVLALPALRGWQAVVLVLWALLLLHEGRLHVAAAAWVGLVLVAVTIAWRTIGFPWLRLGPAGWGAGVVGPGLVAATLVAVAAAWLAGRARVAFARAGGVALALALFTALAAVVFDRYATADATADPWVEVQRAARAGTPPDALILTPSVPGGFRVYSERAITGEWRDGTQQFFSPAFAERWWARMQQLRPGMEYDADGARLLSQGGDLGDQEDEAIVSLGRSLGAGYVVLPAGRAHNLVGVYTNASWGLYRCAFRPPSVTPASGKGPGWDAQQTFLREVVAPNIERYRKSDAALRIVDADGRPLQDAAVRVVETRSAFRFGSALPHFSEPAARGGGGYQPRVVDPRERVAFKKLLNFSIIGYSGKWCAMEPREGHPDYTDLDRYVDWCTRNGIGLEYHFVSGHPPNWIKHQSPAAQQAAFLRRADALLDRYGDRIHYWQVVNEGYLLRFAPAVIRRMRERCPGIRLGISHCARFYSEEPGERGMREMCLGLDQVKWLERQGTPVDFFALHAHRPFGVWPDMRTAYQVMDRFQEAGVRVHISEFGVHGGRKIIGPVRSGVWTPELQAEYYKTFFTVCFSHPDVDVINLWGIGPDTWMSDAGLLDRKYEPKPAYGVLYRLIHEDWHTEVSGQVGLDGLFTFRGFHGAYALTVTPARPGAVPSTASFELAPGAPGEIRVTWHAEGNRLTVQNPEGQDGGTGAGERAPVNRPEKAGDR